MTSIITANPLSATIDFDRLTSIVCNALSENSRRVYQHTYRQWQTFARGQGASPLDLTFELVTAFVNESNVARSTRQNRLSHIRKLLELLAIADETAARHFQAVKTFCKVQRQADDADRAIRSKRALSRAEIAQFLDVWSGDESDVGIRNNALLRLAVYTGLRRSELVALRWSDVDLESQTITVQHGKGDKQRVVAIADVTAGTVRAMQTLRAAQGQEYEFVFPRMTRGKGARFADDKPANSQTVMTVVTRTANLADVGHISPHDLRRTHITTALDNGATLADMQAQAGHSRGETTLRYAQAIQAKARRGRIQF